MTSYQDCSETATLGSVLQNVRHANPRPNAGRLVRATGTILRAIVPGVTLGELCEAVRQDGSVLLAEVVGLDQNEALLAPIGDVRGLGTNDRVIRTGLPFQVPTGDGLLGRILDGLGHPLDLETAGPLPSDLEYRACDASPPQPLLRADVERLFPTGIRAIDGLLACGEGQRIGIYGEPGAGKSSLLGQLVRGAVADVMVVGLIGERGREVREFLQRQFNSEQRRRSVVVSATSDRPAAERLKAAQVATTIAEAFRDQGRKVLLVLDSITRIARAAREIGLAAGEPPARRGFPPSVLAELARLLERSGQGVTGSITAFYTVLTEGDGLGDPIAEETRGILDGHIQLSPELARQGHYPAIDVLASQSRVMSQVVSSQHVTAARSVRAMLARNKANEFLVQVGEYRRGADRLSDTALDRKEELTIFLQQDLRTRVAFPDTTEALRVLAQ